MTGTDSVNLNTVGKMLMGLVNVLQDAKGANEREKEAAVSSLFQSIIKLHSKGSSSFRRSAYEFMELGENINRAGQLYPQFYGASEYIKHDFKD